MSQVNPATVSAPPEIVRLKQGSEEWHEFRKTHIGASEVPIILRKSRWSNPYALYLEKIGQKKRKQENDATSHGHENEPKARELYELQTGFFGAPAVLCMTDWPEWMLYIDYDHVKPEMLSCSADWYSATKKETRTAEIKCPYEIENHQLAREGTVPEEFWSQVQENLFVTQADVCDYVSFWEGKIVIIPVTLDQTYVCEKILPAVDQFCKWLKDGYPLPEGEHDFHSPEHVAAGDEASKAFAMLKAAERRYEAAKTRLAEFCWPYRKSHVGPVDVVQTHYKASHREFDSPAYIKFEVKRLDKDS